jgi:hypothetical protein
MLYFPNFLSKEKCKLLNEIAILGVKSGWIGPGITKETWGTSFSYRQRLTSRMYMNDKKYPLIVYEISNQIQEFLNIKNYPVIHGHGSEGIVTSVTFPGGNVYKHMDPRSKEGLATFRCNILTQSAESGGKLYINNVFRDISVGDLHCYYASEESHYVTAVEGNTSRILWMFGCHRPVEDYLNNH